MASPQNTIQSIRDGSHKEISQLASSVSEERNEGVYLGIPKARQSRKRKSTLRKKRENILTTSKQKRKAGDKTGPVLDFKADSYSTSESRISIINVEHQKTSGGNEQSRNSDDTVQFLGRHKAHMKAALKLSENCKELLKEVLSTAVQFQRHCRHERLCSSDFLKALSYHGLLVESDSDDFKKITNAGEDGQ